MQVGELADLRRQDGQVIVIQFESLPLGILAYNQGPGTLWKGVRGEIPFSEKYYHRVMRSYYRLKHATSL